MNKIQVHNLINYKKKSHSMSGNYKFIKRKSNHSPNKKVFRQHHLPVLLGETIVKINYKLINRKILTINQLHHLLNLLIFFMNF